MVRHFSEKKIEHSEIQRLSLLFQGEKGGHWTPPAVEEAAQVLSETVYSFSASYRDVSSNMNTNYYKYYEEGHLPSVGGHLLGTDCS